MRQGNAFMDCALLEMKIVLIAFLDFEMTSFHAFRSAVCLVRLATQPPGPVILLGHSMGGLLVADAATDISNKGHKRIVGMLAFDCPYIGMHPHVVVSGIASLFAKKDKEDKKVADRKGGVETERQMNEGEEGEEGVHMVNEGVSDDWERYKEHFRTFISIFHYLYGYGISVLIS